MGSERGNIQRIGEDRRRILEGKGSVYADKRETEKNI
jgi:hypothetical protein